MIKSFRYSSDYVVPSISGDLYHNTNEGYQKMNLNVKEMVNLTPLPGNENSIYLGSKSSTFYMINERTGELLCSYQEKQMKPCKTNIKEVIYIIRNDYNIQSFDKSSSLLLWNLTWSEINPLYYKNLTLNEYYYSTTDGLFIIQENDEPKIFTFPSPPISFIKSYSNNNYQVFSIPLIDEYKINSLQGNHYPKLLEYKEENTSYNYFLIFIIIILLSIIIGYIIYLYLNKKDQNQKNEIKIGKMILYLDKILGKGCNGTVVYQGILNDGRNVAIKRILKEFYDIAQKEISLLIETDTHPNIIRYFAKEEDEQFVYIALELCQYTLDEMISKKTSIKIEKKELIVQISNSIKHLHSLNIIHRDIKPQNILIGMNHQIKLSDYGFSKKLEKDNISNSVMGSKGWTCPEILTKSKITKSCDIFSLGCLFYFVYSKGFHPFGESISREHNIMNEKFSLKLKDSLLNDLISKMIKKDYTKRLTIDQVLLHPFFWSDEKKLIFLTNVSDELGKDKNNILKPKLEEKKKQIFQPKTWDECLDNVLMDNIKKFRTYNYEHVTEILRLMRNIKSHYREYDEDVQKMFEPLPHGVFPYFNKKFPSLFFIVYQLVEILWKEDFQKF